MVECRVGTGAHCEQVITSRSQSSESSDSNKQASRSEKLRLKWALALFLVLLATPTSIRAQEEAPSSTTSTTASRINEATASPRDATTTSIPLPLEASFEPTQPSNGTLQHNKLKPINFTLVDELFDSTVDEREMLRRWRNMDGQFQDGIRSILKMVFPQIVAISQDAKVSGDCSGGILKWILSLRNLRSWAIKMLDATGKPTAGIFEGSLTMFGNHRQCLGIRAPDEDEIEITEQFEEYFRGQFCVLHLRPWLATKRPFYHLNSTIEPLLRKNYKYYEKTLYDELAEIAIAFNFIDIRMDLCVPSTCSVADIQRVADLLSRKLEMRAKVMRCDIESRESSVTFVQNLDQTTALWLIAPLGMLLITLTSSILVLVGVRPSNRGSDEEAQQSSGTLSRLVYCLSIQGAFDNLLTCPKLVNNSQHQTRQLEREVLLAKPVPLYGLRNLFVAWFIIVQLTVELKYQFLRESLVLRNMMLAYWPFQIIINTSMIFESLILITAFTYSYSNLQTSTRGLLHYIARKYIRLVPSIATMILIIIVLPFIGIASPVWKNLVDSQSGVCKSQGYLDLLFLQNFISYDKICLPHTWLFCVELQLIALSIPLIILLKRASTRNGDLALVAQSDRDQAAKSEYRKRDKFSATVTDLLKSKAGLLGIGLIVFGAATNFFLVYTNQLPPAWFHTFPDSEQKNYYFGKYLTKAWTHLSTFIVGLYAGYLCRASIELILRGNSCSDSNSDQIAHKLLDSKRLTVRRITFQVAALGCLLSMIFLTFTWSTQELPSPLVSALYDSVSRLVWSLALAGLMVQLCLPGPGGAYSRLSSLFSHPVCIVLGKLSFLAYLTAPLVHTFILAVQEQSLFPSLYLIFHVILGNIVITYLLAFILSLLIEQPIRLLASQLCCINTRTRGCATISTSNVGTTTTSAASLTS